MTNYYTCCGYAFSLNRVIFKDLVHDAWLYHFMRTGEDLFSLSPHQAARQIRYAYFRYGNSTYKESIQEIHSDDLSHSDSPDQLMIFREDESTEKRFFTQLYQKVYHYESPSFKGNVKLIELYKLMKKGYPQKDISKTLGISPSLVNYYVKKVKELATTINNPINGSKTLLYEKLSSKQFEKLPDKDSYISTGEGNETVDILVHQITGKGILIKLNKD